MSQTSGGGTPSPGLRRSQSLLAPQVEEHDNHERWLVTYADMITLLMVLFIVLFALSQLDITKYNALRSGLSTSFGGTELSVLDGSNTLLENPGESAISSLSPITAPSSPELTRAVNEALKAQDRQDQQIAYAEALAEADTLLELQRQVNAALEAEGLLDDVRTEVDEDGLRISLVSKRIVFAADRAELSPRGQAIIRVISPVLGRISNELRVEGHTNQAPGKPKFFASDWDLSTARAVTVLRELNERYGLLASRLSAVGYGKTRPLLPVSDPDSQAINKRVDIIIQPSYRSNRGELLRAAIAERLAEASTLAQDQTQDGAGTQTDPKVTQTSEKPGANPFQVTLND